MQDVAQVLDVYLRGSRTYVQGSQILARTGEWLVASGNSPVLTQAKFSHITDLAVVARIDEECNSSDSTNMIGNARYSGGNGSGNFCVNFYEDPERQVGRIEDGTPLIHNFHDLGDLNGDAAFEIDGRFESFFSAMIQTLKRLHKNLSDDVQDIWFTSVGKAQLPLEPVYPKHGRIQAEAIMRRNEGERLQSLTKVSVHDAEPEIAPFLVGFSCRIVE